MERAFKIPGNKFVLLIVLSPGRLIRLGTLTRVCCSALLGGSDGKTEREY